MADSKIALASVKNKGMIKVDTEKIGSYICTPKYAQMSTDFEPAPSFRPFRDRNAD